MATNPGFAGSPPKQPLSSQTSHNGTGQTSLPGNSLGSSMPNLHRHYYSESATTGGTETTSNDTTGNSVSSNAAPSSYSSKFQTSMSGTPNSTSNSPHVAHGGYDGAKMRWSPSASSSENAPASMPNLRGVSIGASQLSSSEPLYTPGNTGQAPRSEVLSPTPSAPSYAYDATSSNIILPRGTIKPTTAPPSITQSGFRSASTPALLVQPPLSRPTSFSAAESAPKSEKNKKPKKMNSSSLPAAPPSTSVASVPVVGGTAVMAEQITDRWPDALYQGWMKKRNKGKESTAKKRYLVVKTNCIEYYSDPAVRKSFPFYFRLWLPHNDDLLTHLPFRALIPKE